MGKEDDESTLEKLRVWGDKLSIGLLAIGVMFSAALAAGAVLDLAASQTIGKDVVEKIKKLKKKLKGEDDE